jgi:adenosylhomocysteine nucleosidase
MIALTFALPSESSDLIALLIERKRLDGDDSKITYGKIDNRPVAIFHTGVGRKSCEAKIDNFLQVVRPDLLISSGFAGGVRKDLEVGDLILAENFSQRQLLLRAQDALRKARVGKLFTSEKIINSTADRNAIARANGADAVDMETEVIAQACAARGVPLLSLRVISDTARQPLPAPPQVLFDIGRQRTNPIRFAACFLAHPNRILGLIRFAQDIAKARGALAEALVTLMREGNL